MRTQPHHNDDGPRYRVRTHTRDGVHAVVGITLADTGTPAVLSEAERAVLRATVRAVLDLEGHEQGPVLSDVVLTARGPRLLAWWPGD